MPASPYDDDVSQICPFDETIVPRGCQYPGCGKETRAYTEFEGLSYCDEHIRLVKVGAAMARTFLPLKGTGEP